MMLFMPGRKDPAARARLAAEKRAIRDRVADRIAHALARYRIDRHGGHQGQAAAAMGIEQPIYSEYESKKREVSVPYLVIIARALGVSIDELCGEPLAPRSVAQFLTQVQDRASRQALLDLLLGELATSDPSVVEAAETMRPRLPPPSPPETDNESPGPHISEQPKKRRGRR